VELRRGFLVRSADPDDSPERWVVLDVALHHDFQARSADPDD
jgi:hypothetical protein